MQGKENGWRVVTTAVQTLIFGIGFYYMLWVLAQGIDLFMANNF